MLIYRAELAEEPSFILSVGVRRYPVGGRAGGGRRLGGGASTRHRVTVRYVGAGGGIRAARGILWATLAADRRLIVRGYQISGREVLVSLEAAVAGGPGTGGPDAGRPVVVLDRFRLPVGLQAWGVTAVTGAEVEVQATCQWQQAALSVRGRVWLTLRTPGAPFCLVIPFCRTLREAAEAGLRWRTIVGVTGLNLRVEPGGWVAGELVVALRNEGRWAGLVAPVVRPELEAMQRVREADARVAEVLAERTDSGDAQVRGALELDLYWIDGHGQGRWTGRKVPFAGPVPLADLAEGDRLEAVAQVERLTHRSAADRVMVDVLVGVTVTTLRAECVLIGGQPYRLERLVDAGTTSIPVAATFGGEGGRGTPAGSRVVAAGVPLPGPAEGWREMEATVGTPEASGGGGVGRWWVRTSLGGTPAGEGSAPVALQGEARGQVALPAEVDVAVAAGISSVAAEGVRLRARLIWGERAGVEALGPPTATRAGWLELPGPVRTVLGLSITPRLTVGVLVWVVGQGLIYVAGAPVGIDETPCQPVSATALPMLHEGRWALRVAIDFVADEKRALDNEAQGML